MSSVAEEKLVKRKLVDLQNKLQKMNENFGCRFLMPSKEFVYSGILKITLLGKDSEITKSMIIGSLDRVKHVLLKNIEKFPGVVPSPYYNLYERNTINGGSGDMVLLDKESYLLQRAVEWGNEFPFYALYIREDPALLSSDTHSLLDVVDGNDSVNNIKKKSIKGDMELSEKAQQNLSISDHCDDEVEFDETFDFNLVMLFNDASNESSELKKLKKGYHSMLEEALKGTAAMTISMQNFDFRKYLHQLAIVRSAIIDLQEKYAVKKDYASRWVFDYITIFNAGIKELIKHAADSFKSLRLTVAISEAKTMALYLNYISKNLDMFYDAVSTLSIMDNMLINTFPYYAEMYKLKIEIPSSVARPVDYTFSKGVAASFIHAMGCVNLKLLDYYFMKDQINYKTYIDGFVEIQDRLMQVLHTSTQYLLISDDDDTIKYKTKLDLELGNFKLNLHRLASVVVVPGADERLISSSLLCFFTFCKFVVLVLRKQSFEKCVFPDTITCSHNNKSMGLLSHKCYYVPPDAHICNKEDINKEVAGIGTISSEPTTIITTDLPIVPRRRNEGGGTVSPDNEESGPTAVKAISKPSIVPNMARPISRLGGLGRPGYTPMNEHHYLRNRNDRDTIVLAYETNLTIKTNVAQLQFLFNQKLIEFYFLHKNKSVELYTGSIKSITKIAIQILEEIYTLDMFFAEDIVSADEVSKELKPIMHAAEIQSLLANSKVPPPNIETSLLHNLETLGKICERLVSISFSIIETQEPFVREIESENKFNETREKYRQSVLGEVTTGASTNNNYSDEEFELIMQELADDELVLESANGQYGSASSIGPVKAGTIEKLITRLTFHQYIDPDFVEVFFTTFHSFTTPTEFMKLLFLRINCPPPLGLTIAQQRTWHRTVTLSTNTRILTIIKKWVESNFDDFFNDKSLSELLIQLIQKKFIPEEHPISNMATIQRIQSNGLKGAEGTKWPKMKGMGDDYEDDSDNHNNSDNRSLLSTSRGNSSSDLSIHNGTAVSQLNKQEQNKFRMLAEELVKVIKRYLIYGIESARPVVYSGSIPKPIVPKSGLAELTVLDMSPVELARQMTLVDWEIIRQIKPKELCGLAWNVKEKQHLAKNLLLMVANANAVAMWTAHNIVKYTDLDQRCRSVGFFIRTAEECLNTHNFNSLFTICAVMSSAPIMRLKKTWAMVDPKLTAKLNDLKDLCSIDGNYLAYRKKVNDCAGTPTIPFIGVYLTDLTFIEEGNPNYIHTNNNIKLINFSKRRFYASVIQQFLSFLNIAPNYTHVNPIYLWIKNQATHKINEDQLYDLSLIAEPRAEE